MNSDTYIGGRFKLGTKLGSGSFGDIYEGKYRFWIKASDATTGESVAVKLVKEQRNDYI